MQLYKEIDAAKRYLRTIQGEGVRLGLVPTMGALHDGHLSLVRLAKSHADVIVTSIFVNPTQFGPGEDLSRYPRDLEGDTAKLKSAGCDLVLAPEVSAMYAPRDQTFVEVTGASRGLCGDRRPGHFRGVATVVLKLFSIVRPDVAVFGEKDFQQLAVIRALTRDLALDVNVIGAPLVREPDGLAMSSRNAFLSPGERTRALSISAGLSKARQAFDSGERSSSSLLAIAGADMTAAGIAPEYLELRAFDTLAPLERADEPSVILTAARVGSTRLIDNIILRRP